MKTSNAIRLVEYLWLGGMTVKAAVAETLAVADVRTGTELEDGMVKRGTFAQAFDDMSQACYDTAKSKGWWDGEMTDADLQKHIVEWLEDGPSANEIPTLIKLIRNSRRNDAEQIALIHSELSEGLESLRHGNPPSKHIMEFSALEEELADVIIRAMDMSKARGLRVGQAVEAKAAFNRTRPVRHGNKVF